MLRPLLEGRGEGGAEQPPERNLVWWGPRDRSWSVGFERTCPRLHNDWAVGCVVKPPGVDAGDDGYGVHGSAGCLEERGLVVKDLVPPPVRVLHFGESRGVGLERGECCRAGSNGSRRARRVQRSQHLCGRHQRPTVGAPPLAAGVDPCLGISAMPEQATRGVKQMLLHEHVLSRDERGVRAVLAVKAFRCAPVRVTVAVGNTTASAEERRSRGTAHATRLSRRHLVGCCSNAGLGAPMLACSQSAFKWAAFTSIRASKYSTSTSCS